MKKILLLVLIAWVSFSNVNAKKASAIWFFMAQTDKSVNYDDNINVVYEIVTEYANGEPDRYGQAPYPKLKIRIENKCDKLVFVDLGTSFVKKNGIAFPIYIPSSSTTTKEQSIGINVGSIGGKVGLGGSIVGGISVGGSKGSSVSSTTYSQRIISVPPKSSVILPEAIIFTPDSEKLFGNMFYFKNYGFGSGKFTACLAYKSDRYESGNVYECNETNSPFSLGGFINYSFKEDMAESKGIETNYYVKKIVGSSFGFSGMKTSMKEVETVNNVLPNWQQQLSVDGLLLIRIWAK